MFLRAPLDLERPLHVFPYWGLCETRDWVETFASDKILYPWLLNWDLNMVSSMCQISSCRSGAH